MCTTSAQNRRLPLSGNKRLWLLAMLIIGACSPKVRPPVQKPAAVTEAAPAAAKPTEQVTEVARPARQAAAKTSVISLLLPFDLDQLASARGFTRAGQRKASLAIDFYQGFKLGLDSLTGKGYSYQLRVYDSKDQPAQAHALAANTAIRNSSLMVGPVFPEDVRAFVTIPALQQRPVVSPLAPTAPAAYHNAGLITVAPPLEYHARAAALYLCRNLGARQIFVLRSGYSEENKYAAPFQKMVDSLGRKKIKVVVLNVVRGNLSPLSAQLSRTAENYFVVPSTNQSFLMVTLHSLDTLASRYPVVLFGHPNWSKFSYLHADLLQRLKTHITSADRINYRSAAAAAFIRAYRNAYHHEPAEYAFKGFDEAMYFGEVIANDQIGINKLNTFDFTGLHNSFHFIKKPGQGWINAHVNLLKYVNFELKQVE